jgi:NCAIR mutase (PurE)-related protein
MSLIEILNPDFTRELLEAFETISNALQNITRAGFDDTSRFRVRAEYLDDGYVRVRDTSASIDILEMLREFSWTYYNLAESNKLLSDLTGVLSSVGTDKLRTSVVDVLPESPFNLTKIGGTALTGRDWSGDFAKLQNLDTALSTRASESTLSGIKSQTDKLTFDTSNRLAIQNPPNLDVLLSTRASESTLSGIKTQTDKLTFDASNYLQVNVKSTVNPSNLDVTLSTRASESTLSGLSGKFPSAVALGDSLSNPTTTIVGDALLGFDGTYWRRVRVDTSGRLAIQNEPNLDVALSTRASESTLSGIKSQTDKLTFDTSSYLQVNVKSTVNPSNLDVALSTRASESTLSAIKSKTDNLDVALSTRASETTLSGIKSQTDKLSFDTSNRLAIQNPPNMDVALSTRASESTLSGIKSQTDKLTFDASNYLQVNVKATVNPSNLDVALSTRASESTLSGLSGKFPSAVTLADNLGNPTTTIIGAANLGWDGTYWRRLATDTSSRLRTVVESIANPSNLDVALSTRASESTLSGLSGKFPSAVALSDSLSNPTTTIIGVANLGWDGTYWRRLATDTSSRLRTVVESVANPSNLDVALSTRASESTLSTLSGKFPSAVALSDSLSNPTTTIIGNALLGFDGTYWRRVRVDTSGRLAIQNEPNLDVALSTRASESTLSSFVGTPDSSPPSKGVVLLGYDGTYLRRLRVDSTGRLLLVLG